MDTRGIGRMPGFVAGSALDSATAQYAWPSGGGHGDRGAIVPALKASDKACRWMHANYVGSIKAGDIDTANLWSELISEHCVIKGRTS